jgi:hypothetical protein
LGPVVATLWASGVVAFMLPVAAGLIQMRRYRRRSLPLVGVRATLQALAAKVGITRRIALLTHESVGGPMTFGVARPVVFLPPDWKNWETTALHRALAHELEHVRRWDCLVHGVSRAVCAVYWFHPLVWIMWRQLALEAERACDDAVLADGEPTQYAEQLVDLAEKLSHEGRQPLLAMANRDDLATRVSAVLDPTLPRGRAGLAAIGIASVAVLLVAGIVPLRAVTLSMPAAFAGSPPRVGEPIRLGEIPQVTIPLRHAQQAQPGASAQAAVPAGAATPTFEAASIKRNTMDGPYQLVNLNQPGRISARKTMLRALIAAAYQPGFAPRRSQMTIVGLPDWDESEPFDIEAVATGTPDPARKRLMLQALLAERFKLAVHREVRSMPVFDLVTTRAGRLGPQLAPHSTATA